MSLVVEDGTGLSTAESFVSVSYADSYHSARGNDAWGAAATADKEEALRRASGYLSDAYRWPGYRVKPREQALMWPRFDVYDAENYPVDSDAIPVEIKKATAEVALKELSSPGSMAPEYTGADGAAPVKSEAVGSLKVEYDTSRMTAESNRPVLLVVKDILRPLLGGANSSTFTTNATRR